MKTLHLNSIRIFCALLSKMDGQRYLKIESECFMPLSIEKIGEGVLTPHGKAAQYSLSHTYTQNGDVMRDPEMHFLVIDQRSSPEDYRQVKIIPYSFRQDNLGLFQQSVLIMDGLSRKFAPPMQADHAAFAAQWLDNINAQGFLK